MSNPECTERNWRIWVAAGATIAGVTIVLAALRDHLLRDWLTIPEARSFDLALQYQFYHSLGLILCGMVGRALSSCFMNVVGFLFLLGIVAFSGGLYLRIAVPNVRIEWIMPLGAISWVIGWLLLAFSSVVANGDKTSS